MGRRKLNAARMAKLARHPACARNRGAAEPGWLLVGVTIYPDMVLLELVDPLTALACRLPNPLR